MQPLNYSHCPASQLRRIGMNLPGFNLEFTLIFNELQKGRGNEQVQSPLPLIKRPRICGLF